MATTAQQIDEWIQIRSENEHLEFKAAENRYDFEELVEYCVALANEGGGRIILGVTDKMPRRVVGTKAFDVPERTVAGIFDKVIQAVEDYQLPGPDFRVGERRTTAVLFAHLEIEEMDRNDRIRACYQHCCLRHVMNEQMTNQSLRERFKLPGKKMATVSQIIAATVEAGKIKLADAAQRAPRYRSYIPFWA